MDFSIFYRIAVIIAGGVSALGSQVSEAFDVSTSLPQPAVSSSYTLDLSDTEKPEVLSITLDGADNCNIANQFSYNYLHSELVGLFGCPVEILADEYDGAELVFHCDRDNMRYVPLSNLIVLRYNEPTGTYVEEQMVIDHEDYTVTVIPDIGGVYMLADGYEWYSAWGRDTNQFATHDTILSNSDYTPEFTLVLPSFIDLNPAAKSQGQNMEGFDYLQFASTEWNANPSFTATYMMGENIWQYQCDSFCEAMHRNDRYSEYSILDLELQSGAQAKLYTINTDVSSRGGSVGASILLHVKVSNDKLLSFSYGVTEIDGMDVQRTIDTCIEYLSTFRWVEEPEAEAYIAAEPWDIHQHPELLVEESPVQLEDYSYSYDDVPEFTIKLPDCVEPCPFSSPYAWEDENGITSQMLMCCNQSDDIYYDFELYSSENMWAKRLVKDEFIFSIEGESHTVEDVSSYTGCDSEIYVLRFADTGKVESSHLRLYVFGIYKCSDTEIVVIRCDLWADTAEEYLPIALESLKSFRFVG